MMPTKLNEVLAASVDDLKRASMADAKAKALRVVEVQASLIRDLYNRVGSLERELAAVRHG